MIKLPTVAMLEKPRTIVYVAMDRLRKSGELALLSNKNLLKVKQINCPAP